MNRVDTATAVGSLPAQDAAVTPGYFSKGNPATSTPATIPGADWFNAIQEELVGIVEAAGITLDRTKHNQVISAIQRYGYWADTGAVNAYAITPVPALTGHVTGAPFRFKATNASTGASTINISGLGAVAIKKNYNQPLVAGDIVAGQMVQVVYDGTNYQLINNGQSVDLGLFGKSHGASGYQRLPNGLILQWGNAVGGAGADQITTLPIAFPTTFMQVYCTGDYTPGSGGQAYFNVVPTTLSTFTSRASGNTSGRYLAIGY
jgi:hypothetical protein